MRKSLLFFVMLLAGCSGAGSEGPVLTFADFENPPTTTEVLSDSSTTTVPVAPATTTTSTTSTTLLVVDTPRPVAIRTANGFSVLEGPGAPQRVVERPVEAGFDDLRGGFLFQLPGAGIDPVADQRIFWSRPSSPDAQPYLDVNEGSLLKLWGTAEMGGSPHMILTITDDPDDPERVERLVVFSFSTGDRVLGEIGGSGSGPTETSYGGGRFLIHQQAGEQAFFEFRNDQGAVISLTSNPQPGCSNDPTCPAHPVLDASGSFLAYIQEDASGATDLVILDLDLDEETRRIRLPDALGDVLGLEFSDTTVIVNRRAGDGQERALIVDSTGATFGEFGLPGFVQFLRSGPEYEGVVQILS